MPNPPLDLATVRLNGIGAVVLDLDDTLYPERSYSFSGFQAVGQWLRGRLECPFDPARRMRELYDSGDRRRVFNKLLEEAGCGDADRLVPEMVRCYRGHVPTIELFPDARAALDSWRGRFRLGLISDGPLISQQKKLEALQLREWFDDIILTDEWGPEFWKPHPRAFQEAENRLDCRDSSVVYIADNCGKDFVSPRRLGWRTVWIRRPGGIYEQTTAPPDGLPEFEIRSFAPLDLLPAAP